MIPRNEQYMNGHALILGYARMHGVRSAMVYARLISEDGNASEARKAGALDAAIALGMDARSNGRLA